MAKRLSDGNTKLIWAPSVADVSAPTVAELTGGTAVDLTPLVSMQDFVFGPADSDTIDDAALSSTTNSTAPGRSNFQASMTFFRDSVTNDDKAWTTFTSKGLAGYLVCRRGVAYATAITAADKVEVMQVLADIAQPLAPAANTYEKFRVGFFPQDKVDLRATVAA